MPWSPARPSISFAMRSASASSSNGMTHATGPRTSFGALVGEHVTPDTHPNDHVNMSQSSSDVIPTAIHVSAYVEATDHLIPALMHLVDAIDQRASQLDQVVKTGRTHLMDALPLRMSQELG